ncbi:MAG: peptidoglycan bridge formation glycyltransferase FemA/FemB family protein [bacterium]|nr:peptidoglycan bridge formation glycyltransferase FemA/FemB family protein [bacterium]
MVEITVKEITDKNLWEKFLSDHPESNFLQSWCWGDFHQNFGNSVQRTGFYKDSQIAGVMLSVVESAKRGRYLTVPGGPIIDWENSGLVKKFVEEAKLIARREKCVFVRVRPQLESNEFSQNIFAENGFKPAPMHLHAELTSRLEIVKPEEELLAQMRKTTRYEIKKAISMGINTTTSKDPGVIKDFYDLQIETAKRQKFVPFSFKFLHEQFKVFSQDDKALLYQAEFEGKLLSQAFIIFYGQEAVYHYGASTADGRRYPGAYLIQWEAIREAKKRGMAWYNFWGVAPLDDPNHRFYGVSVFKRGFGGQDFSYLHARDLVIDPTRYKINSLVENIRKITRHV